MPVIYRCRGCGRVLYRFERVGQSYYGLPTPTEFVVRFGRTCPYCGRPLNTNVDLDDVRVEG